MAEKLRLYGFNNLTKALSFNIYDVCYAKTAREQRDYIAYIDEQYNSERLTNILTTLTDMIGAKVLNIAKQDYDPQGASVTILIAEGSMVPVGDTWTRAMSPSTPIRSTIRRPALPPSGWISTWPPAGRSPPCPPWTTSSAPSTRTLSPWTTGSGALPGT